MKVEMTFNNDAVLACGYHKEEIYRKIKNEFQKKEGWFVLRTERFLLLKTREKKTTMRICGM